MNHLPARMNRLFAADGKCFDIALDHGFFNEAALLSGIEDMAGAVRTAIEIAPDAIQVTPGQAHLLQSVPGKKPALVMRIDTANVYGSRRPAHLFSHLIGDPLEQAVHSDAACVIINLFHLPENPRLYEDCVRNAAALVPACRRYGMPLMVEPLTLGGTGDSGYDSLSDCDAIVPLVRLAAEIGADIIKCEPPANSGDFARIVQAAGGRPVLPRGGGRISDEAILTRTWELMQAGAAGVVYGRNIFQHPNPRLMGRSLNALVHAGSTVSQVLAAHRETAGCVAGEAR